MERSQRVRLLGECERIAAAGGLSRLKAAAAGAITRLDQPMRLAVVGQIKRGKSTLVNALLGTEVAATGQLELTFTVNEFHHAPTETLRIQLDDGTVQELPPGELREVSARDAEDGARLRRIRKVEFGLPNELLRTFRLVDTPGLGSVHGKDSENTADYLGISGFVSAAEQAGLLDVLKGMGRTAADVAADSAAELDRADAILYLFSRAMHERDHTAIEQFVGSAGGAVTPLKAFGVLSRCDQYWPPAEDLPGAPDPVTYDPMEVGRRLADEYLERPETRRLFFTVVPVAGLVGVGAQALGEEEFEWLADLAKAPPGRLVSRLSDAGLFANRDDLTAAGITLPKERRRALVGRIGVWGIHLATGYLRDGLAPGQVRERLLEDSGVARLRSLAVGHFGNRASLIKLGSGLDRLTAAITAERLAARRAEGRPAPAVAEVAALVERIRTAEPGFAELGILAEYYNGELTFTADEVEELLRVTGEHGVGLATRLGLSGTASPADLVAAADARIKAWAVRSQDPLLERRMADAARRILRTYDRLAHRAEQARVLLETDHDPEFE
ncbi:dynamin family protein [Actinocorallia sp. B10E7]|uniref:dynamin family protein n=1 Tax=Actinocorallia sp. B10E7 TaxID=3153558 RepID=UPI00325DAFCA